LFKIIRNAFGEQNVAGLAASVTLGLVNLYSDEIGNPERPKKSSRRRRELHQTQAGWSRLGIHSGPVKEVM
jgi:hypothetical protein